jgi:hypothetical protein
MGSTNEKNQRPKISCYCPFKVLGCLVILLEYFLEILEYEAT